MFRNEIGIQILMMQQQQKQQQQHNNNNSDSFVIEFILFLFEKKCNDECVHVWAGGWGGMWVCVFVFLWGGGSVCDTSDRIIYVLFQCHESKSSTRK